MTTDLLSPNKKDLVAMGAPRYLKVCLMSMDGSKLTPLRPLLLKHITTSFGMQPTSMISIKSRKDLRERHSPLSKKKSLMMMNMPMQKNNFPLIQNQWNTLLIKSVSHLFTPRCHRSLSSSPHLGNTF